MYCKIICGTLLGIQGMLIDVEVDISEGFPKLDIVGMPGSIIKEAKERVRTGIKNSGYTFPYKRITINLAPAHIRKEGVGFDLAIAIGILSCERVISIDNLKDTIVLGELALDGHIRPIKGIVSLLDEAQKQGMHRCIIPKENLNEAQLIKDLDIIGVTNLREVVHYINSEYHGYDYGFNRDQYHAMKNPEYIQEDFSQVIGQTHAKRGLEIAVSGMHHAMLKGPPGIGKTMLAKRVKTILPPLSDDEIIDLTKIYSAAEKLLNTNRIITERPFRYPHHSITRASFIGGGSLAKPGEISMSHKGVLMLDEFPEFRKDVIESLREPLEQGYILLSRNHHVFSFPADFILIAAMNPCPCGYFPNLEKCQCLPSQIEKYHNKISGAILDRIDLHVEMMPIDYKQLKEHQSGESSQEILRRVEQVHAVQKERYINEPFSYNANIPVEKIQHYCQLTAKADNLLKRVYLQFNLSSRCYHRLLKVARTIADMTNSSVINENHVAEAILFKQDA